MRHETLEGVGLNYAPCRYGASRIFFRGPRRPLDGPYVAFVGGTETYGKFVPRPFVQLVEEGLGIVCANFGVVNASIDAFVHEKMVQAACHDSVMNVVQVTGAQNISNRFYTVHPRRNDRFVQASTVLRAIFPEIDFTDFTFTRHMLGALHNISPERFEIVRMELQEAWKARMRTFLRDIGPRTMLLWFAPQMPSDAAFEDRKTPFQTDPLFITRSMLDELRPMVQSVVVVQPSVRALQAGTRGMVYPPPQLAAAQAMPGPLAHEEAAEAVLAALQAAIPAIRTRRA